MQAVGSGRGVWRLDCERCSGFGVRWRGERSKNKLAGLRDEDPENTLEIAVGVYVIAAYVLAVAAASIVGLWSIVTANPPVQPEWLRVGLTCGAVGGLGGCMYCLRAIYLNYSVRRVWGNEWIPWYLIRPVVSAGSGAISYVFLKAGLLILESGTKPDATEIGFYALAFIAGLNVDRFISKLEDIGQAVWGIEKSRASKLDAGARDGGTTSPATMRGAND